MNFYAGIGSRETPQYVLDVMERLAVVLRRDGWTLRTGHAPGADQAFEAGAMGKAQIFLPWHGFEVKAEVFPSTEVYIGSTNQAIELASKFHPNWQNLSHGARSLHARNVHQILGRSCNSPVEFVLCWTPDAAFVGGTAQALRVANAYEIPIYNLADEDTFDMAFEWAWGSED